MIKQGMSSALPSNLLATDFMPSHSHRKSTGAGNVEPAITSLSEEAKARSKAEMDGRTGATDSEASDKE